MRLLTGDTIIRVRRPLPLPRKRELTGDTRIRLNRIIGLKEWHKKLIQDREDEYDVGEESPATGKIKASKNPAQWVTKEEYAKMSGDDPRFQRNRSAKNNRVIDIKDPIRFKKDTPLTNESEWIIPAGSMLDNAKSIARAEGIDEVRILIDNHLLPGGKKTTPKDWEKIAGDTDLSKNGKKRRAHVHGYRAKGVGKVKMKRVSWLPPNKGRRNGR